MIKTITQCALFVVVTVTSMYLTGCATVPVTGRRQVSLVPERELISNSFQAYDQILEQSRLSSDAREIAMVDRVGRRLVDATIEVMKELNRYDEIDHFEWEITLLENDSMVNAFCMPGGKIVVYSGILPITQDDTGLAVVVGHEIAHAVAKHSNERMSHMVVANVGSYLLANVVAQRPESTQRMLMTMYGLGAQYGALLPYSRLQEREADRMGLILMAEAGYDPRAAIPLWERMKASEQYAIPEFMSTHPLTENRIEQIRSYLPEALEYYNN